MPARTELGKNKPAQESRYQPFKPGPHFTGYTSGQVHGGTPIPSAPASGASMGDIAVDYPAYAYTDENAQMIANIRRQLGEATDFDKIRKEGQQQVMDKGSAMARQFQTAASRGGAAMRGGGTGVLRAPAERAVIAGLRGVEADVEKMKGARLQQVAAASLTTTQNQLALMGYDANVINLAMQMKEKALGLVSHRLEGDVSFAAVLMDAERQYAADIASGMPPLEASARFQTAITMGGSGGFKQEANVQADMG